MRSVGGSAIVVPPEHCWQQLLIVIDSTSLGFHRMDKLKRVLGGQDEDEEAGIVAQVSNCGGTVCPETSPAFYDL